MSFKYITNRNLNCNLTQGYCREGDDDDRPVYDVRILRAVVLHQPLDGQ
jgi:hypothetical protein